MKNKILKKILVATAMLGSIATYSQGVVCNESGSAPSSEQNLFRISSAECSTISTVDESSSYTLQTSAVTNFSVSMDLDQYWGKLDPSAQLDKDAVSGDGTKPLSSILSAAGNSIVAALTPAIATPWDQNDLNPEGGAIYSLNGVNKSVAKRSVNGIPEDILLQRFYVVPDSINFATGDLTGDLKPDGLFITKLDISIDSYTGPLASIIFRFESVLAANNLGVSPQDFDSFGVAKDLEFGAYSAIDSNEVRFKNVASGVIGVGEKLIGSVEISDGFDVAKVLENSGAGFGSRMVIANASIRYLPQTIAE